MSRRRKSKPEAPTAPTTGSAREVTWDKLLTLFDKTLHEQFEKWRKNRGVEAVVCFENVLTGERSAMAVGHACTHRLEEALNGKLAGKSGDSGNDKIPIEYAWCRTTAVEVQGDTGAGT